MTAWGSVAELLGEDLDDIEFLGRGSSGSVYRATQRSLARTVAVKVFRRFADDETNRVLAEARAQGALSWQANVVSLYSQGVTPDGFPFLVMEYAPGGSLADRVRDRGPLPEEEWRRVGAQVAAALTAAHEAGVIHCDVKPSNVLFAADGSARLADFGIARATGMTSGTLDSIEGSLAYVPPELLDGERPQPANDIYSLGLTLLFAASGQQPVPPGASVPETIATIHIGVDVPVSTPLGRDSPDRATIEKAIDPEPTHRPTAREVELFFDRGTPPLLGRTASAARSRWRRVGVVALVMTLVIGMVGTLFAAARMTNAAPEESPVDLCQEYTDYIEARRALLTSVSAELELSASPTLVVEQLLVRFPQDFAEITAPFIRTVISLGGTSGEVTHNQLAAMTIADNLRSLGDGKGFLYDGESGSFDPAGLPAELQVPGAMFSEANEYAADHCPGVTPDLAPAKARMHAAIYSNLSDPAFMDGFFKDPGSVELFDVNNSVLLGAFAWDFFERILAGNWQWFFDLLEAKPEIRRAIANEHPHALLAAASNDPQLLKVLEDPSWMAELQAGYERSSRPAQIGMWSLYEPQMRALGMEPQ